MTLEQEANGGFSFYRIHILESLADGNLHTGRTLFRSLEVRDDTDGHVEYLEIDDRSCLFQTLGRIRRDLATTRQIPLLHIEAHGDEQGLQLASGERVEWRDLSGPLTAINVLCQMHLLVVFAACYGEDAISMARLSDPAPLWGCLGPRAEVSAGVVQDGFLRFYEALLRPGDLRTALAVLPGGQPADNEPFVFWSAEYFFLAAYRRYVLEQCNDENLAERKEEIARALSVSTGLLLSDDAAALQEIEAGLRNHRRFFEQHRRTFFMLDRYPQNESRFRVGYQDLRRRIEGD